MRNRIPLIITVGLLCSPLAFVAMWVDTHHMGKWAYLLPLVIPPLLLKNYLSWMIYVTLCFLVSNVLTDRWIEFQPPMNPNHMYLDPIIIINLELLVYLSVHLFVCLIRYTMKELRARKLDPDNTNPDTYTPLL
jgi:hypothetical protein